ncbi:hypothetical protein [Burkholderia ubonensis]|uniref:hypothetical protein n=1 Tax=Burkholderia ubonensis TaxID=101571 RepID=UPI001E414862|nr:hypothetical protein [Burkholderia ubonensis]
MRQRQIERLASESLDWRKARDRMVSYWDCYYRSLYKRKRDYVGFRLFDQFDEWSRSSPGWRCLREHTRHPAVARQP